MMVKRDTHFVRELVKNAVLSAALNPFYSIVVLEYFMRRYSILGYPMAVMTNHTSNRNTTTHWMSSANAFAGKHEGRKNSNILVRLSVGHDTPGGAGLCYRDEVVGELEDIDLEVCERVRESRPDER